MSEIRGQTRPDVAIDGAGGLTERLHAMAMNAIAAPSYTDALDVILNTAVRLLDADRGNIQVLGAWGRDLEIVAHVGFDGEFLERFRLVDADDDTACARCLRSGERVVIEDVATDEAYAPYRAVAAAADYRAVQSTPLPDAGGRIIAVLSTHWAHPHTLAPGDAEALDRLARDAAVLIVRLRERDELQEKAQRAAFLATIVDEIRPLGDPVAVQETVIRLLGRHLGVSRAFFAEAEERGEVVKIAGDYRDGLPSAAGRHRLDAFGPTIGDAIRAGRILAIDDVRSQRVLTNAERATYDELSVRAHVTVPLVKEGRLVALLSVHQDRPRAWTPSEVALIEEVAERTWDAVERARAEEALRQREDRFRAVFESIDEGFCIAQMLVDDAGRPVDYRFLEVNRLFESMTGLVDATGRTARELVPELEDKWIEIYARAALDGRQLRFEQGSAAMGRWFDVYAAPVGPRSARQFAIVFSDITRRRRSEEERQELLTEARTARHDAEEANRSKSQFLANMSHELRTPLNAIVGYSDLLLAGVPQAIGDAPRRHVERIRSSSTHLIGLIEEILTFAKVEAGREEVHTETFDLVDLVLQTAHLVEPLAVRKGLSFDSDVPGEALPIHTDPARVRQILLNLLSNAVKFTDHGRVDLILSREDGWARIEVRDTGIGIDAAQQDLVFEPFRQLDAGNDRKHGGTGLGLSVSRQLARLLGGDVQVESAGGDGSTFTLRLPVIAPDERD